MSKKDNKTVSRFPGITSFRTLNVLAKNSARGADDSFVSYNILSKEVASLVQEIARLRTPNNADPETAKKLSDQRAALRDQRDAKERSAKLALDRGISLEGAYDEYEYLVKRLTGEDLKLRKVPRFNQEKKINVTDEELVELIETFDAEEKAIAYEKSGLKPPVKDTLMDNALSASSSAPLSKEEKKEIKKEEKLAKSVLAFIKTNCKKWYFILGAIVLIAVLVALAAPKKTLEQEKAEVVAEVVAQAVKEEPKVEVIPVVEEKKVQEEVKPKEEKKTVEVKETDIIQGDGFYAFVMPEGVTEEEVNLYLSAVSSRFQGASYRIKNNTIVITYDSKTAATEVSGNIGTPVETKIEEKPVVKETVKEERKEEVKEEPKFSSEGEVDKKATRYPFEEEAPSKFTDYQRDYVFPVWSVNNVRFGFGPIGWTGIEYYKDKINEPYIYNSTYGLGLDFGYEHNYNNSFGLTADISMFSYFVTFTRPSSTEGLSQINVVVVTDGCFDLGIKYHKYILDKLSIDAGVSAGLAIQKKDTGDSHIGVSAGVSAGLTFHYLENWAFMFKMSGKLVALPNYTVPKKSELNYIINPITLSLVYTY